MHRRLQVRSVRCRVKIFDVDSDRGTRGRKERSDIFEKLRPRVIFASLYHCCVFWFFSSHNNSRGETVLRAITASEPARAVLSFTTRDKCERALINRHTCTCVYATFTYSPVYVQHLWKRKIPRPTNVSTILTCYGYIP